ncbi:MAG: hypothetical protein HY741_01690 [Chloroflexi bacterium]|nr:hypothetical protein [Chloroflexota bacterium]
MFKRFMLALSLLALLALIPLSTSAQAPNPWETPVGQQCFEKWITESMSKLNAYNGSSEFNGRKPWSINKYGILEGGTAAGPRSVYAPDDFKDHGNNKYWEMWDLWVPKGANGSWGDPAWDGAGIENIRSYVTRCVGSSGPNQPPPSVLPPGVCSWTGVWNTSYNRMTLTQNGNQVTGSYEYNSGTLSGTVNGNVLEGRWQEGTKSGRFRFVMAADCKSWSGGWAYNDNPPGSTGWTGTLVSGGGGGGGGTTNFPPIPDSYGCTTPGTVINAIDGDPENQLAWCDNRVPFGDESSDKGRCFTFRYQVPPGGVKSALLRMSIKPIGDADTDNIIAAVGQPTPNCGDNGKMPGCVLIHPGLAGASQWLDMDLLNNGCDKKIQVPAESVQPLESQLQTGVLHVRLQDDTAVYGAQLVLNCSPTCKVPPTGGDPNTNVSRMTLQAAKRTVIVGQTVTIPVWLIKAGNVANINFDMSYDANVARPEGTPVKGNLLDNALFSVNPNQSGTVKTGFAQTSGLNGTGTVMNLTFRATGKPGDRTPLNLTVTTINNPDGGALTIDRINGEISILNSDGTLPGGGGGGGGGGGVIPPGDCDGDKQITESDALCALEMSVQLRPVLAIMDVDGSGDVTSRDAVILLKRAIGGQ